MSLLLKMAALGSLVLLGISVYPGVLVDVLCLVALFSPLWFPALVIGAVIFLIVRSRRARAKLVSLDLDLIADEIGVGKAPLHRRRGIILALTIIALSLVFSWFGIPRHVAFVLSRTAFERHVATAPAQVRGRAPGSSDWSLLCGPLRR